MSYFSAMKAVLGLSFVLLVIACNSSQDKPPRLAQAADSIAMLKADILKDSLNPALWQKLYYAQLEKGDSAGALGSLKFYTLLEPENAEGWLELAWLLAARKDPQALVVTDSLQKVQDVTVRTKAHYLKGIYFENIGRWDTAIQIFDSVIVSNYTYADAYMEKGVIQHDQKKYAEALKTFQQAFLIRKNDPEIFLWISRCYEGLGNKAEAEDWMKKYEALKQ